MNWPSECGAILPCLNEAGSIGDVVSAVREHVRTVVVVDDGSQDETGIVAVASGATVLRHSEPLGKGAALKTGLSWLVQRGFKWSLLIDGDGQHAPSDIPSFFDAAVRTGAALVVGNRMPRARQIPWLRRHVNRRMSCWISRLAGHEVPDSQCGFRLLHLPVWERLAVAESHFEMESQMILSVLQAGGRMVFVPIQVIYGREQSKVRPIRDGWRWCRWWWKTWHQGAGGRLRTETRCNFKFAPAPWNYDEAVGVGLLREPAPGQPVGKPAPGSGL